MVQAGIMMMGGKSAACRLAAERSAYLKVTKTMHRFVRLGASIPLSLLAPKYPAMEEQLEPGQESLVGERSGEVRLNADMLGMNPAMMMLMTQQNKSGGKGNSDRNGGMDFSKFLAIQSYNLDDAALKAQSPSAVKFDSMFGTTHYIKSISKHIIQAQEEKIRKLRREVRSARSALRTHRKLRRSKTHRRKLRDELARARKDLSENKKNLRNMTKYLGFSLMQNIGSAPRLFKHFTSYIDSAPMIVANIAEDKLRCNWVLALKVPDAKEVLLLKFGETAELPLSALQVTDGKVKLMDPIKMPHEYTEEEKRKIAQDLDAIKMNMLMFRKNGGMKKLLEEKLAESFQTGSASVRMYNQVMGQREWASKLKQIRLRGSALVKMMAAKNPMFENMITGPAAPTLYEAMMDVDLSLYKNLRLPEGARKIATPQAMNGLAVMTVDCASTGASHTMLLNYGANVPDGITELAPPG